jgi:uncharacterized protein with GYD domain
MSTYIILINWTDQGIRTVKESPQRLATAKKVIEAAGGKMTGFYLTMGRYDMIAIAEAPNDESVATIMLGLGSGGGIRTETMKAFTEDQYRDIIAKVK